MLNKKKILLIGPLSPPITGCSMVNDLVYKRLAVRNDVEIDVINRAFPFFNERIGYFSFRKAIFYIRQYFRINKIISNDVIYIAIGLTFFGVIKDLPFFIVAKIWNKEVIVHVHGNYLYKQYDILKGFKRRLFHYVLSIMDKGIVSSKVLIHNLTPFIDKKNIFCMHYFVEDFLLKEVKKKDIQNNEKIKILYLSNLMKEKGIIDFLVSLKLMDKEFIDYEVKIIGGVDNENKNEIFNLIDSNPKISYSPPVRGEDKKKAYLWANTFVLPTYYSMEGEPISLLEAMATGNIIVTTDHAAISDICGVNTGFIVRKNSPEDIKEKLIFISKNINNLQSMMDYNYEYARKKYTTDIFIKNLINVFYEERK
ncbi:glycosyltransferase [Flavobacteriaceae bacterium UJ101]|nr:glycosyltransferase [Flavobacteriaceae bacterium UJ101]